MEQRALREVITYVQPFVPVREWFDSLEESRVFVSAYRAYFVPSESVSVKRTLQADFGRVRAVYLRWDAPYVKPDQNVIELANRRVTMQPHPLHEYRTGPGVLLLLITPLPKSENSMERDSAMERVRFVRSLMVALMGRNAAYRHEFDIDIGFASTSVGSLSATFSTPEDETPRVNGEGVELVAAALRNLSSLDDSMQSRVRLALRWYQRSFGDDRIVRDTVEEDIDKFINCWLAWETLAMERYNDINSITRALGNIHKLEVQRIGELFPIGRMYDLRAKILHLGQMRSLGQGLIRFMTDVFADLLLHTLSLPSGHNSVKYLDGSA